MVIAASFLSASTASADLYGQVNLSYQETTTALDGQASQERSVFTQGYTIGGGMMLTSTISISGDVRHTVSDTDGEKTDSTYPQVTLNYSPPSMSNFSFGYTRTEVAPSDGIRMFTSNLSSAYSLPMEDRSSLSLSFNRSTSQDYETPRQIDTVSTRFGLSTGYGLTLFEAATRLNYSFTHYTNEDDVAQEKRETPTHIVTADATRGFWEDKVRANLNVGYSYSETKTTSLGGPSRFEEALTASGGLFSVNVLPATGLLSSTQGLIDGNKVTAVQDLSSADIDLRSTYNNMGIELPFAQGVHEIDLYIKTTDSNIASYVSSFGWQLYTSNDGLTWAEHPSTFSYDPFLARFRFVFGEVTFRYFKVVNHSSPTAISAINVTEIEAIGFRLETAEQTSEDDLTRDFGGFNLSVSPISGLDVGYSLNYDHSAQSRNDTDSTSLRHGLNMTMIVLPQYLTVNAMYATARSESSHQTTGQATTSYETETDNYMLAFTSNPLPTVNGNLSYSHIDNMTDGDKTSKSDSIETSVSLKLYRGVDVVVGISMSETKDLQSDAKTDTLNRYTTLNLLPLSDLNIVVNASYSTSDTESAGGGGSTSSGKTLNVSASYTPTRRLYLSAAISLEPATSQNYAVTWMPSRTIQTSVNHGISDDFTTTGASINWTPLTNLTLFTGYNVSESKGAASSEVESLFARATMRF